MHQGNVRINTELGARTAETVRLFLPTTLKPPKRQILDLIKLKVLADDNFKFDENWQKVLQRGRKQYEKKRKCKSSAISPFPTVFLKDLYYRHVDTRLCLGNVLIL